MTGEPEVAVPDRAGERPQLGAPGREPERCLADREREGKRIGLHLDLAEVDAAAGRDPVVLRLVHPGHPGAHRRVRGHRAGQLVALLELERSAQLREVERPLHPCVQVGIRDWRPYHQPRVDRVLADHEMQAAQVHYRAVGAAPGIRDAEVEEDVPRGKREIGVAEGAAVHLRVEGEGREGALAVLALDSSVHRERARGPHRLEVPGVDRGHERQDVLEVGVGRPEPQVEAQAILRGGDAAGEGEEQLVEADAALLEREGLLRQVGRDVRAQVEPYAVEVRNTGELHRR